MMTNRGLTSLSRALLASLVGCVMLATGVALAESGSATFNVRYRSADTVYLEAGRSAGISVGDRLEIIRDDEVVASIDIVFVSEHSSSCKILMEQQTIEAGDQARFDGGKCVHAAVEGKEQPRPAKSISPRGGPTPARGRPRPAP